VQESDTGLAMSALLFFLNLVELPLLWLGHARSRQITYDEKGDGGDDGAVVRGGKAGVHLADGAGLV
jgi:hypothetical protein